MKKNKRVSLVSLGAFLLSSSVLLAACGHQEQSFNIMANYNGQADLLLSLQMPPDYYPLQFQENGLRDYITHPQDYVITDKLTSEEKNKFHGKIQNRFKTLMKNVTFGPSLWNDAIYEGGQVQRNVESWTNKKTKLLFMERFVLDDYPEVFHASGVLPEFDALIQTNFRASRDPFTIFNNQVYADLKSSDQKNTTNTSAKIAEGLKKHADAIKASKNSEAIDALYRYDSYMDFWNNNIVKNQDELQKAGFYNWISNNNKPAQTVKLAESTETTNNVSNMSFQPVFYPGNVNYDSQLAALYQKVILSNQQVKQIEEWSGSSDWKLNYLDDYYKNNTSDENTAKTDAEDTTVKSSKSKDVAHQQSGRVHKILQHHPAFEQQALPGASPAAEGSQRDTMVYLYQLANGLNLYEKKNAELFQKNFRNDWRHAHMQNALYNVSLIGANLKTRLTNIRKYLQKIQVVDSNYNPDQNNYTNTNSKIVSIVTVPPSSGGAGNATIQTISKFGFIYHDLGLKQVLPVKTTKNNEDKNLMSLDYNQPDGVKYAGQNSNLAEDKRGDELFNLDDNGWWWNLGNSDRVTTNMEHFQNTSDTVIITATDADWNRISGSNSNTGDIAYAKSLASIAKNVKISEAKLNNALTTDLPKITKVLSNSSEVSRVEYGLWNEGLRSPFSVNMVLEQLLKILQKQYDANLFVDSNSSTESNKSSKADNAELYKKAMDWGSYWTDKFINDKDQTTYVESVNSSNTSK